MLMYNARVPTISLQSFLQRGTAPLSTLFALPLLPTYWFRLVGEEPFVYAMLEVSVRLGLLFLSLGHVFGFRRPREFRVLKSLLLAMVIRLLLLRIRIMGRSAFLCAQRHRMGCPRP
jgi:vacuolar-type H+-ATPase subunit I/STV1